MTAEKDPVVSGLIAKRRELAGIIHQLQRQLDQHRADLVQIDGAPRSRDRSRPRDDQAEAGLSPQPLLRPE
jgi:hypothetical protein